MWRRDRATREELPQHALDYGAQGAVGAGEPLGPDAEEFLEMLVDQAKQRRLPRPPRLVDPTGDLHAQPRAGQVRGEKPAVLVGGPPAHRGRVCSPSVPGQVRGQTQPGGSGRPRPLRRRSSTWRSTGTTPWSARRARDPTAPPDASRTSWPGCRSPRSSGATRASWSTWGGSAPSRPPVATAGSAWTLRSTGSCRWPGAASPPSTGRWGSDPGIAAARGPTRSWPTASSA
jgi:hypothetical protein